MQFRNRFIIIIKATNMFFIIKNIRIFLIFQYILKILYDISFYFYLKKIKIDVLILVKRIEKFNGSGCQTLRMLFKSKLIA